VQFFRIIGLVALVLFLLAGCGGDWESSTSSGSGADAPPEDTAPPSTEPVPPTEEEEEEEEEANEHAGTYKGKTTLKITVEGQSSSDTRSITIKISDSGSVKVTGSGGSVGGKLSGDRITARIPVSETDPDTGVKCSGTLPLAGTISGDKISGKISGKLSCKLNSTPLDGGSVTGKFSASK